MRFAEPHASRQRALPCALSIAGSDSGAGAGVQADLLTFAAHRVFGTTAITCLTAQNPSGVAAVHPAPPKFVVQEIESICGYFRVRAIKTGMLFNRAIIAAVSGALKQRPRIPVVVDPVMVSTSGTVLLEDSAIQAMAEQLFPLARIITPNLDEGAVLLGRRPEGRSELREAAVELARRYRTNVLLKGGHLRGPRLVDVLAFAGGDVRTFEGDRIGGVDTHGSGCTLSAAIASRLAMGADLSDAVASARRYLRAGMRRPRMTAGKRFISH